MKRYKIYIFRCIIAIGITVFMFSCNKFLEAVPDTSKVIPATLDDLEAMLWDGYGLNGGASGLIEMGTDDFYLKQSVFDGLEVFSQQVYTWDRVLDITNANINQHWGSTYKKVLTANVVLDKLKSIRSDDQAKAKRLEGEALFIRSLAFFQFSQIFMDTFDPATENEGPGIPLKLSSDINEKVFRSTVAQTYQRIIEDLNTAKDLLPTQVEYKTRPALPAVEGLLAKVYLIMGNFKMAEESAEKSLAYYSYLSDYNKLNSSLAQPFKTLNDEIVYFAYTGSTDMLISYTTNVDSTLISLYEKDDLRRKLFFEFSTDGSATFKGWYSGINNCPFLGINTSENYLIKAECLVRRAAYQEAKNELKTLLKNRYSLGKVAFIDEVRNERLLSLILEERRKELLFRGSRWSDLRRLNREGKFQTTLWREVIVNGEKKRISLAPNDKRYIYPIPLQVIELTGVVQNER